MTTTAQPVALSRVPPVRRRMLLRLSGEITYWFPGSREHPTRSWGTIRSGGKKKFFAHLSKFLNLSEPPALGTLVSFRPMPARGPDEMPVAVDILTEKNQGRSHGSWGGGGGVSND
jgi:hypothetical protein